MSTSSGPGPGVTVTADLPVRRCPTTIAIAATPAATPMPALVPVTVPAGIADELAVYADSQDTMALVAPKGWDCTAMYGADGSGGIVVYPAGQAVPQPGGAGWDTTAGSAVTAITGTETSACYTCGLAQACPLFASAASTFRSYLGHGCGTRPASEVVTPLSIGIASFEDPPGVRGTGSPSGGQYPANGVMTYYPRAASGSWVETCTLPAGQKAECTASLNAFLAAYGKLLEAAADDPDPPPPIPPDSGRPGQATVRMKLTARSSWLAPLLTGQFLPG